MSDTTQTTLTGDVETRVVNRDKSEFDVDLGREGRGDDADHMNNTEIGRPGWLGNPYRLKKYGGDYTREESIKAFREDFHARLEEDDEFRKAVEALRGETLGCFCKPQACHGDVVLDYLRGCETS
ncbi:DUF4326 domain-containing protein [Haladaptatus sp. NG-SE-30]